MLRVRPLTLKQANETVALWHRHHKPVVGHRFSLAVYEDERLCGACIVGRPVARMCDAYATAEVTRLVTDGTKNACSILYAAAARACEAMGFDKIQTYILESESGTSLKAAGWIKELDTSGGAWEHTAGPRRQDQPTCPKSRWAKVFHATRRNLQTNPQV